MKWTVHPYVEIAKVYAISIALHLRLKVMRTRGASAGITKKVAGLQGFGPRSCQDTFSCTLKTHNALLNNSHCGFIIKAFIYIIIVLFYAQS